MHDDTTGAELPAPAAELDELALAFDQGHEAGTGALRWTFMMREAADRAAAQPGYSPRGKRP